MEIDMSFFRDLRIAVRSLARVPALWITVALTLALGIGANAAIFVSGDRVITEWTLQANVTEPGYYAGVSLTFPVSVHGVSIVLIDNGKVADWSDYYDKLTSRRGALASYFTEW